MKTLITLIFLLLACVVPAVASAQHASMQSPGTSLFLQRWAAGRQQRAMARRVMAPDGRVQAFLAFDDPAALNGLDSLNVQVNAVFQGIATILAPAGELERLSGLPHITGVEVAHTVEAQNDMARLNTRNQAVLDGQGFNRAYDGTGVIVGVIDKGIEFNNPAFLDANGVSRVRGVYLPSDSTGQSPVVDGKALPGSAYTAPEQIARLTTLETTTSHGTQVAATAVGTPIDRYGGMAPGADILFACLLSDYMTDVSIANSVYWMADYARAAGKPLVINISSGDWDGPHDGSSYLPRVFDQVIDQGKAVIVLSVGNSGGQRIYMHKAFQESGDSVSTALIPNSATSIPIIMLWNQRPARLALKMKIIDRSTGQVMAATGERRFNADFSLDDYPQFAPYATGHVLLLSFKAVNGRFYMQFVFYTTLTDPQKYALAVTIIGNKGDEIDAWSSGAQMRSLGLTGYVDGNDNMSMNDMATGVNTITVGSYGNRRTYPCIDGNDYGTGYVQGALSSFSSRGIDARGYEYPFITAPGGGVVSMLNSYNVKSAAHHFSYSFQGRDGRTYSYYTYSGTSAAAPCVSGIIACWLQAQPNLSVANIKNVIKQTAIVDDQVLAYKNQGRLGWGNGKINAQAGLTQILNSAVDATGVADAGIHLLENPVHGQLTLVSAASQQGTLTICSMQGTPVLARKVTFGNGPVQVDVSGLAPGLYVATVQAGGTRSSFKLVIQ